MIQASLAPSVPLRSPTGGGRPYPAEVVAGVRALVVDAGLPYREAASRSGLPADTVGRWARRFGWRRREAGGAGLPSPLRGGPSRREAPPGVGVVCVDPPPCEPQPPPPGSRSARLRPPRKGEGQGGPYPPEVIEAARARVEGTRLGLERIALELGIARWTLQRWRKRFGWQRPSSPRKAGPQFFRARRLGRPYGGDAVGTARDLVLGSNLPMHRIAARAGVSRATVYRWMKRPGWTRYGVEPGRRRYRPPYGPAVMAAARELYEATELSTRFIAARLGATPERVAHWARTGGWTRPRGRREGRCLPARLDG